MEQSKEMIQIVHHALEEKKGEDIRILDISHISVIADYFVIVNGNSSTQIDALVENVEEKLKFLKERGVSVIDAKEDALTGKLYGFCFDLDGTKIEFYNM